MRISKSKRVLHESINSYKQWDWKRVNVIQKRLIEKIKDQSKPQIITMIMCWNSVYNDEKKTENWETTKLKYK